MVPLFARPNPEAPGPHSAPHLSALTFFRSLLAQLSAASWSDGKISEPLASHNEAS